MVFRRSSNGMVWKRLKGRWCLEGAQGKMVFGRGLTLFIPSNFRGIYLSGPSNFQCWGRKTGAPT